MTAAENKDLQENRGETFALNKKNYKLMIIGILVVIGGFILMIGGGSEDPMQFSDDIFSFRRITLAPIVVLIGYVLIFYSILKKDKAPQTRD